VTTADDDRIALRRAEAIRLRVSGRSYREIGEATGVSSATAFSDIKAVMAETAKRTAEDVEAEREIELYRADSALKAVSKLIAEDALDDELMLKAVDRMVKLQEQRAKLLGLYAPTKSEVAGSLSVSEATPADARRAMADVFGAVTPKGDGEEAQ
jgi:hypothetical protein